MIARINTPFGALHVCGDESLVTGISWRALPGQPGELDWITVPLQSYFRGEARTFPGYLLFIDGRAAWSRTPCSFDTPDFSSRALLTISKIPYGSTITYGELARKAGNPSAARAAGRICGSNPIPVIIPCHRVVAARGLGGYSEGIAIKKALLDLESRGNQST